jgi:hypothetical protein
MDADWRYTKSKADLPGRLTRKGYDILNQYPRWVEDRLYQVLYEHRLYWEEGASAPYPDCCNAKCACYSTPGYYIHLAAIVAAVLDEASKELKGA